MTLPTIMLRADAVGPDPRALIIELAAAGLLPAAPARKAFVNSLPHSMDRSWVEEAADLSLTSLLSVDCGIGGLSVGPGRVVTFRRADYAVEPARLAETLSTVPFELCSFSGLYSEWLDVADPRYPCAGFGGGLGMHGWAAAVRGAGHDRLVSRRWLEHGPWRLVRASHDTSFVQFHALGVDATTAADQARQGHSLLGNTKQSGFIGSSLRLPEELPGDYVASTREVVISVAGRDVSHHELLQMRAVQRRQALGADRPIDRVRYVFADISQARTLLHQLWLRELVCDAIAADGTTVRLTDDYAPPPHQPPAWAR